MSIRTATSTRDGVQSTAKQPQAKTITAWLIWPKRRSEKLSAQTCTSSGTGLVSIWSSRPLRTWRPICSTLPISRSATRSPTLLAP